MDCKEAPSRSSSEGKEHPMAEYSELLKMRRSVRDYEAKDVPLDIVKEIITESCLAPSSGDGQPWRFIIIRNRGLIKRLSDECKKNLVEDLERNPDSPRKKYEDILRDPGFNVFYNAPCLVYIAGSRDARMLQVDCALAAAYFMFSASEKGLGTCWIGLGKHLQDPSLLREIGLPGDHEIVAPIILGYPKEIPEVSMRQEPRILKVVS
jgi:nitroreductase